MGIQHFKKTFYKSCRTLKDEQLNDKNKKELAIKNGITEYIIIDTSKTDFDYIKDNILQSRLSELFDLSSVNWSLIRKQISSPIIKEICDFWNTNTNISTGDLSKKYHFSYSTIQNYLQQGNKLGWCKYDPKNYRKKNIYINDTVNTSKPIMCLENNKYFKSVGLCTRKSLDVFGIQLNDSSIRSVLQGKYTHHRNYHFQYITKQEFNQAIVDGFECYGSPYKL